MSHKKEAATRHHPIAWGRGARDSQSRLRASHVVEPRRGSEMRIQAAVVKRREDEEPYADVPCTD
jgi:hypothetical protein